MSGTGSSWNALLGWLAYSGLKIHSQRSIAEQCSKIWREAVSFEAKRGGAHGVQ